MWLNLMANWVVRTAETRYGRVALYPGTIRFGGQKEEIVVLGRAQGARFPHLYR